MKKKRIIVAVIGTVIALWLVFAVIDTIRVQNNHKPIFAFGLESTNSECYPKETRYYGLGYQISKIYKRDSSSTTLKFCLIGCDTALVDCKY